MTIPIRLLAPLILSLVFSALITEYINAHHMLEKGTVTSITLCWIWMFARGIIWFSVLQVAWSSGRHQGSAEAIAVVHRVLGEHKDV